MYSRRKCFSSAVTVNSVPVVKKDLKLEEIRDIQEIPKLVINNGYEHTGYQPIDSHASQELQEIMYNELEAIKKVQPLENDNNKSNVKHYVIIQKLVSIINFIFISSCKKYIYKKICPTKSAMESMKYTTKM